MLQHFMLIVGVEVKLKVTTLELDDQTKAELESDQEITDSGMDEQTASKEEKKKSEVKVYGKRPGNIFQTYVHSSTLCVGWIQTVP